MSRRSVAMIATLVIWLGVGGCASRSKAPDAILLAAPPILAGLNEEPPPPSFSLEPFTQSIEGTTVSFEMMPVNTTWAAMIRGGGRYSEWQVGRGPFWISKTEVPWQLYDLFTYGLDETGTEGDPEVDAVSRPSKPYISMDRGFGRAGYPVISVSFHGAQTFCKWLSRKTGRTYRLPTQAEWVLACGAGSGNKPPADSGDLNPVGDYAWYAENANFKTHLVATKKPNAIGLYDMYGNASEWCSAADGSGVTMGGSHRDGAGAIGCSARVEPTDQLNELDPQIPKGIWWLTDAGFVGLRVVCVPEEDLGATNEN